MCHRRTINILNDKKEHLDGNFNCVFWNMTTPNYDVMADFECDA